MDTISVAAIEGDGLIHVHYRVVGDGAKNATYAGVVSVRLASSLIAQREALAELSALHYILDTKQLQGQGRLGNDLKIQVTAKEIKRALAKGQIKRTDAGEADNMDVVWFSTFMATKFFEASVEVTPQSKWKDLPVNRVHDSELEIAAPPFSIIPSPIGEVIVSRHALNRYVERFSGAQEFAEGGSLSKVPDMRWRRAWKTIEGNLPNSVLAKVPEHEQVRIERTYGKGVSVLHHSTSQAVYVVRKEPKGLVMVTVLLGNEYCQPIALPTAAGQKLIYRK